MQVAMQASAAQDPLGEGVVRTQLLDDADHHQGDDQLGAQHSLARG